LAHCYYNNKTVKTMSSAAIETVFGSLDKYTKGSVEIISGQASHYAFSNVFEVAEQSLPYEKVVVGLNLGYVIETLRAEGQSPWYTAAHDEFAIVMDGEVRVDFLKLDTPVNAGEGTQLAGEVPAGKPMGYVLLKRGHQCLLPVGTAYRFEASRPGVILQQTIKGPLSVEKWADICLK
jgi:quercetin dioxygenase-like cupin family protein